MIEIKPALIIKGKEFSPKLAENATSLKLDLKVEPGEITKRGKYKNKPSPIGSAYYKKNEFLETWDEDFINNPFIKLLDNNINILRQCGADEIILDLEINYKDQCNFAFSKNFINRISELGLSIYYSIYEVDELEKNY